MSSKENKTELSACCGKISRLSISTRHGRRLFCELCGKHFIPQLLTNPEEISSKVVATPLPELSECKDMDCICPCHQEKECSHYSDCAVHNEPAYPNGECNCGGYIATPLPSKDWMEEFVNLNVAPNLTLPEREEILSFISSLKDQAYKEGYEYGYEASSLSQLENDTLKDIPIVLHKVEQIKEQGKAEERQKIKKDLIEICNRCKTERGLGRAVGNYIDWLDNLDKEL